MPVKGGWDNNVHILKLIIVGVNLPPIETARIGSLDRTEVGWRNRCENNCEPIYVALPGGPNGIEGIL